LASEVLSGLVLERAPAALAAVAEVGAMDGEDPAEADFAAGGIEAGAGEGVETAAFGSAGMEWVARERAAQPS
jgi:hypothetical protein